MDRCQFSIRGLLIGFVVLSAALAGMTIASPWIASAVYTLEVLLLAAAVCGVAVGEPRTRAFWVGWLAFGAAYLIGAGSGALLVPAVAGQSTPPHLITEPLVDYLSRFTSVAPKVGDVVQAQWTNGAYYAARITQVAGGKYEVTWLDGSAPLFVLPTQIKDNHGSSRTQSHTVIALLIAWGGGIFSLRAFGPPAPLLVARGRSSAADELEVDQNKKSPDEVFGARTNATPAHDAAPSNGQTLPHGTAPQGVA